MLIITSHSDFVLRPRASFLIRSSAQALKGDAPTGAIPIAPGTAVTEEVRKNRRCVKIQAPGDARAYFMAPEGGGADNGGWIESLTKLTTPGNSAELRRMTLGERPAVVVLSTSGGDDSGDDDDGSAACSEPRAPVSPAVFRIRVDLDPLQRSPKSRSATRIAHGPGSSSPLQMAPSYTAESGDDGGDLNGGGLDAQVAAHVSRLLRPDTVLPPKVRQKIEKIQLETALVMQQHAECVGNSNGLPPAVLAEVTEEMHDGIGVLFTAVRELTARRAGLMAAGGTAGGAEHDGGVNDALLSINAELQRNTANLKTAIARCREWGLPLPTDLVAISDTAIEALPLAATDPNADAIHAERRAQHTGSEPFLAGSPSMQRIIGGLVVLANVDGKAATIARLEGTLLPLYEARRVIATRQIVPLLLDDEAAYDREIESQMRVQSSQHGSHAEHSEEAEFAAEKVIEEVIDKIDTIAKVMFEANHPTYKGAFEDQQEYDERVLETGQEYDQNVAELVKLHQIMVPQQIELTSAPEIAAVIAASKSDAKKHVKRHAEREREYNTEDEVWTFTETTEDFEDRMLQEMDLAAAQAAAAVPARGKMTATEAVADGLAITSDPDAPDPGHPAYALYIRKVATAGSIILYLLMCAIASVADCGAEVLPGGLKGLRRIVFKTCLNYGCDFSKCKDGIRATLILPTLAALLQMLLAVFRDDSLVVVRIKNRYGEDPQTNEDYDAASSSGYRDVQLLCLFKVGNQWRYGEVQLNLQMMVAIKGREGGGHTLFKFGRSIMAFVKSVYAYEGTVTETLIEQASAGMVISVTLIKVDGESETPAGKALLHRLFAAMGARTSRVRHLKVSEYGIADADCVALGHLIGTSKSLIGIDLEDNEIGDAGCEHLGAGVARSKAPLRFINLCGNHSVGAEAKAALWRICKPKDINVRAFNNQDPPDPPHAPRQWIRGSLSPDDPHQHETFVVAARHTAQAIESAIFYRARGTLLPALAIDVIDLEGFMTTLVQQHGVAARFSDDPSLPGPTSMDIFGLS